MSLTKLHEGCGGLLNAFTTCKEGQEQSKNEVMELGSRVENKYLTALVRVCRNALHIMGYGTTCKFMTFVYILR